MEEAIRSVLNQTYQNTELIVIDDGSSDKSKQVISSTIKGTDIPFIDIKYAIGNCSAFNKGLEQATGDFVIDLAADDILHHDRIEEGIKTFAEKSIGVEFCNVLHIDQLGQELRTHFRAEEDVPEGDLYEQLITSYFISPPGMMFKRAVIESLGGYDEELSYEDFDFWIRSSREHAYGYTNKTLVKKRDVQNSLAKKQFRFLSTHQKSTLAVCRKIKALNRHRSEQEALRRRCFYEMRNCLRQGNIWLIPSFLRLVF